jgi:hypothetical protein
MCWFKRPLSALSIISGPRWISTKELILPDNRQVGDLPAFFEGKLGPNQKAPWNGAFLSSSVGASQPQRFSQVINAATQHHCHWLGGRGSPAMFQVANRVTGALNRGERTVCSPFIRFSPQPGPGITSIHDT